MATTTAKTPKKLTRADRESARRAAASANASMDLARAGRIALVVFVVLAVVLAAMLFVPWGGSLGGPLQASRLEGAATLTVIPKTKGHPVTFGLPVPWNTGAGIVELEGLQPLGADGVEVLHGAVVPLGAPPVTSAKGLPPKAAVLEPLENFPRPAGDQRRRRVPDRRGTEGRRRRSRFRSDVPDRWGPLRRDPRPRGDALREGVRG